MTNEVPERFKGFEQEYCKDSPDEAHCDCWWDGEECHFCHAPAMTREEKIENGMIDE